MLLIVLSVLLVIVSAFAVVVARSPGDFRIERSASMAAPPERVFAQVNDFQAWEAWSPWAKTDPAMKQSYEGAPAGEGAVYTWKGNSRAGEGRMEILESDPSRRIGIDLQFVKPFPARNVTEFTFTPEGAGTRVRWTMTGKSNFACKAFAVFMSMDKMVGTDFEKGLAALDVAAKAQAA